jgi:hypothetical protein
MSYLSLPRIHFMGISACSPPTTNNNNYNRVLDPETVSFFPPYDPANMDDATFRKAMCTLVTKNFAPFPIPAAQVLNGNWNYFGDNAYYVQNAAIYAIESGKSTGPNRITSPAQDGLIGTPIQMCGNKAGDVDMPTLMVDSDPTSNFSTQLFSGKFSFGATGRGCTAASTDTVPLPRAYTRWVDLARNLLALPDACFATIWLQPLPKSTLQFDTSGNQSPTLALLQQLSNAGAGLIVRLTNYYFQRKYTDPQLYELFQQGNFALNESVGILLGTIGVWNPDEPSTYAPGRMLLPNTTRLSYTVPGQQKAAQFTLAPASAVVDTTRQVITLDLATTFPEINVPSQPQGPLPPPPPSSLQKIDLGTASVQVLNPNGSITSIGTFLYDTPTYLATAGVVEIPYTAQQAAAIAAGSLQVVCSKATVNPVLTEKVYVADSDEHCVYVTEGESTVLQFRVAVRGAAPTQPLAVNIDQYRCLETNQADPVKDIPLKWMYPVPNAEPPLATYLQVSPASVSVGNTGIASVTIKGLSPGCGFLRFMAGPSSDNPVPVIGPSMGAWMSQMVWAFFVNVRVLPADRALATVPDSQINWNFIYTNVLQYYYRFYPVMDAYLMLNDPNVVGSANGRAIIKARTSKSLWNSTLYMPHTREMSDGKRTLLQRWCDMPPGT